MTAVLLIVRNQKDFEKMLGHLAELQPHLAEWTRNAGSLQGVTRTAPLAIFSDFAEPGGFVAALALSAVLILVSAALLLGVKLFGGDRLEVDERAARL